MYNSDNVIIYVRGGKPFSGQLPKCSNQGIKTSLQAKKTSYIF